MRRCKTAVDDAQKRAQEARENAEALPLIEGPQDYVPVDAALPSGVNFGPAERARMVKQSLDICEKKGVIGSGYIPKIHQTTCTANSKGLFAYYQYAEASFILTCRTKDGGGSGWAGITGIKDVSHDRRGRADRVAVRQGAQEPEAAGDRAGPLHGDPRAARQRALPLADDRPLQRAHGGGPVSATTSAAKQPGTTKVGEKLFSDAFTLQERHRQPDPAADADRHRRHGGAAGDLDREGRAQDARLRPRRGRKRQKKEATPDQHQPEPGDGRLGHVGRADDQDHQARPARHVLLVHPRRRPRRRCSTPA